MNQNISTVAFTTSGSQVINIHLSAERGMPTFKLLGLKSASANKIREIVISVLKKLKTNLPQKRLRLSLNEQILEGFDIGMTLPIALQLYSLSVPLKLDKVVAYGELDLEGNLEGVKGVLQFVKAVLDKEFHTIILPYCAKQLVKPIYNSHRIRYIKSISDAIALIQSPSLVIKYELVDEIPFNITSRSDALVELLSQVEGQYLAKRALQMTIAGGHSVLLTGSMGTGKTMLTQMLPADYKYATDNQVILKSEIDSLCGNQTKTIPVATLSIKASYNDFFFNTNKATLGSILASVGGFFVINELPTFNSLLKNLLVDFMDYYKPHLTGFPMISYCPTTIIATSNVCPCGKRSSLKVATSQCKCNQAAVERYFSKVSPQLRQRFDLYTNTESYISESKQNEQFKLNSYIIEINNAVMSQNERFLPGKTTTYKNSFMRDEEIKRYCILTKSAAQLLDQAINRFKLNGRDHKKLLKIARTIADFEQSVKIERPHLLEALSFRSNENF